MTDSRTRAAGRVALEPAWLLHRREYRDSSQLLEALSLNYGRVGLVARGVRRPGSRLRGVLQPFQPLLLSWQGRGELFTLTGAEPGQTLPPLRGDALMAGFYLNELLLRLLAREDPHPELVSDYARAVGALAGGAAPAPSLRRFERRLLEELGLAPEFTREVDSGTPVVPDRWYRFDPEAGPRPLAGDASGPLDVPGRVLLALAEDRLEDAGDLRLGAALLRRMLDSTLGGRPLKSREVMLAMRRGQSGRPMEAGE